MYNRFDCQLLAEPSSSYGNRQVRAQMVIMFMRRLTASLVIYFSDCLVIY
jgi:hypothetical protein